MKRTGEYTHFQPLPSDIREAQHYLPRSTPEEREAFACRQLQARRRVTQLLEFYRANPCRMARPHILAACAIMMGRFCGYSRSFDAMFDTLIPVDAAGQPLTEPWRKYAEACAAGRPWDVREELWLNAYMTGVEAVCNAGLEAAFYREADEYPYEPTWQFLKQHMQVTIGARLIDREALGGTVAYETAMARTMSLALRRLFTRGWKLLGFYVWEATRAVLSLSREPARPLVSYRRGVWEMTRCAATAWSAFRVYRRGIRQRERGSQTSEEGWPLLAQVLGDRVGLVHPEIVRFYSNPARFDVTASLELNTLPAKLWSRLAALVMGQGLYECDLKEIPARFRIFRHADGSMHFIRELYCGRALRVFDSDFVVREVAGKPTLFEVFVDLSVDVEMEVTLIDDGGLRIRGRNIYLRGFRLPATGLKVEFHSRTTPGSDGTDNVEIDGRLLMEPGSAWGRFLMCRLLGRPKELGHIHYTARPAGH